MDPVDAYVAIRRTAAEAEARMTRAGRCVGLGATAAAALVLLCRAGAQPVSYLARSLGVVGTSATYLADALERSGYAERHFSAVDRRIHDLVLTDRGREAAAIVLAALRSADGDALPADDRDIPSGA